MDTTTIAEPLNTASANLLLPDLIAEVLELRAAADEAGDDQETYRLLAQQALAQLHQATVTNRRLTDRCRDQQRQIAELLRFDDDEAAA